VRRLHGYRPLTPNVERRPGSGQLFPDPRVEPKWLLGFRPGYAMQCRSSDERGAFGGISVGLFCLSRTGDCDDTRVCPGREEVRAR
jgi:hypothetical protein